MASIIKQWLCDFLLGSWDFAGKNDVADFLTFICILLFLIFVYRAIKWFFSLFTNKYIV